MGTVIAAIAGPAHTIAPSEWSQVPPPDTLDKLYNNIDPLEAPSKLLVPFLLRQLIELVILFPGNELSAPMKDPAHPDKDIYFPQSVEETEDVENLRKNFNSDKLWPGGIDTMNRRSQYQYPSECQLH